MGLRAEADNVGKHLQGLGTTPGNIRAEVDRVDRLLRVVETDLTALRAEIERLRVLPNVRPGLPGIASVQTKLADVTPRVDAIRNAISQVRSQL